MPAETARFSLCIDAGGRFYDIRGCGPAGLEESYSVP